jgi:hypothetical protein
MKTGLEAVAAEIVGVLLTGHLAVMAEARDRVTPKLVEFLNR